MHSNRLLLSNAHSVVSGCASSRGCSSSWALWRACPMSTCPRQAVPLFGPMVSVAPSGQQHLTSPMLWHCQCGMQQNNGDVVWQALSNAVIPQKRTQASPQDPAPCKVMRKQSDAYSLALTGGATGASTWLAGMAWGRESRVGLRAWEAGTGAQFKLPFTRGTALYTCISVISNCLSLQTVHRPTDHKIACKILRAFSKK